MKKWFVFILGIITGIILTIIWAVLYYNHLQSENDYIPGLNYFETPKEFTISDKFEIFQVLPNGALAHSRDMKYSSDLFGDPIVYILATGQNTFYDDQIVSVPTNGKVIQVGTYKYESKIGEHVVPVLIFEGGVTDENTNITESSSKSQDGEIAYAETPTAFTTANKFKVREVLDNGVIANCKEPDCDIYFQPTIYIPADGQNMYYDDQIITVPAGKKAVQIGTIKIYPSVYPIIEFR